MSKSLSKDQQIKKKVRDTPEWKQLRIDIQEEYDNRYFDLLQHAPYRF